MNYYAALDISLRSVHLCVMDEKGEIQAAGYQVVCMEARQVKVALSAMRNKTDKNDARGIAQLLRTGWYSLGPHQKYRESPDPGTALQPQSRAQ